MKNPGGGTKTHPATAYVMADSEFVKACKELERAKENETRARSREQNARKDLLSMHHEALGDGNVATYKTRDDHVVVVNIAASTIEILRLQDAT